MTSAWAPLVGTRVFIPFNTQGSAYLPGTLSAGFMSSVHLSG